MSEKKTPQEQMTDKNNELLSSRQVLNKEEFNKADKTAKEEDAMRTDLKKG